MAQHPEHNFSESTVPHRAGLGRSLGNALGFVGQKIESILPQGVGEDTQPQTAGLSSSNSVNDGPDLYSAKQSRTGSGSTCSGNPGLGLTVERFYNLIGRGVEKALTSFAIRMRLDPEGLREEIVRYAEALRQIQPSTSSPAKGKKKAKEGQAESKRRNSKVEKRLRKLVNYVRSPLDENRQLAIEELISLSVFIPDVYEALQDLGETLTALHRAEYVFKARTDANFDPLLARSRVALVRTDEVNAVGIIHEFLRENVRLAREPEERTGGISKSPRDVDTDMEKVRAFKNAFSVPANAIISRYPAFTFLLTRLVFDYTTFIHVANSESFGNYPMENLFTAYLQDVIYDPRIADEPVPNRFIEVDEDEEDGEEDLPIAERIQCNQDESGTSAELPVPTPVIVDPDWTRVREELLDMWEYSLHTWALETLNEEGMHEDMTRFIVKNRKYRDEANALTCFHAVSFVRVLQSAEAHLKAVHDWLRTKLDSIWIVCDCYGTTPFDPNSDTPPIVYEGLCRLHRLFFGCIQCYRLRKHQGLECELLEFCEEDVRPLYDPDECPLKIHVRDAA